MTGVQQHKVRHDGLDFHVIEAGSGRPLFLLHGGGSRAEHFLPLMTRLAAEFRVIAYDQRGFARTGAAPDQPVDHAHWASDLTGVMHAMGIDGALVLGWSMGCSVAINAAASRPDAVQGLILVGAPDPASTVDVEALRRRQAACEGMDEYDQAKRAASELALQLSPAARNVAGLLDGLVADRMATPPALQARTIAGFATRPDLAEAASRVRCPARLVTGELDRITPPTAARAMALALGAPDPDMIAGSGHYVGTERPDELAALIKTKVIEMAVHAAG